MAFNVFKSTDAGAPQMPNAVGSLITVLDACLVNGYGSGGGAKAPLGFTKTFESTNNAIYRMGGGSSQFLRIADTAVQNATNFRGLSAATAVADESSAWSAVGNVVKTDATGQAPLHWMVVGDEKGFFILTRRISNGYIWNIAYFGDIDSYDTLSPNRCIISSQPALLEGLIASSNTLSPNLVIGSSLASRATFNIKIGAGNETNVVGTTPEVYASSVGDFHIDGLLGKGIVASKLQIVSNTYPSDPPYGTLRGIRVVMNEKSYTDFLFNVNEISGTGTDAGKLFLPIALPDAGSPPYQFHLLQISEW